MLITRPPRAAGQSPSDYASAALRESDYDFEWVTRFGAAVEASGVSLASAVDFAQEAQLLLARVLAIGLARSRSYDDARRRCTIVFLREHFGVAVLDLRPEEEIDEEPPVRTWCGPEILGFGSDYDLPFGIYGVRKPFYDVRRLPATDEILVPVVSGPMPDLEPTIFLGDRVTADSGGYCTVGALARRGKAQGFITVRHGLTGDRFRDARDSYAKAGAVDNACWDAIWVPLLLAGSNGFPADFMHLDKKLRPFTGAAPGRGLGGDFLGAATRPGKARIEMVDPILPYYDVDHIARVYTDRSTQLGDSGAVLWDEQGAAIGMATGRTVDGATISYSFWNYMAGVLDSLEAELMSPDDFEKGPVLV